MLTHRGAYLTSSCVSYIVATHGVERATPVLREALDGVAFGHVCTGEIGPKHDVERATHTPQPTFSRARCWLRHLTMMMPTTMLPVLVAVLLTLLANQAQTTRR